MVNYGCSGRSCRSSTTSLYSSRGIDVASQSRFSLCGRDHLSPSATSACGHIKCVFRLFSTNFNQQFKSSVCSLNNYNRLLLHSAVGRYRNAREPKVVVQRSAMIAHAEISLWDNPKKKSTAMELWVSNNNSSIKNCRRRFVIFHHHSSPKALLPV